MDKWRWPSEKLLAVSRIGFGLSFLIHYLSIGSWIHTYFSFEALGNLELLRSPYVLWSLYGILLLSSLTLILGAFTRISLVVMILCHALLLLANNLVLWGWGYLAFPFAWLMLFIDPGRVWSIDARYLGKRKEKTPAYYLFYLLLISQISLIYIVSNVERVFQPTWLTGDVLYGLLYDPIYSRVSTFDWRSIPIAVLFGHYLFWFIEICGAFAFLIRPRMPIILGLFALHILLGLIAHIQTWSIFMFGFLSLLLIQNSEFPAVYGDLKKKLIASVFCVFFVIQGVFLPVHYPKAYQFTKRYLNIAGLGFTPKAKVFQFHNGRIAYCVLVVGFKDEKPEVAYRSPIEPCTGAKVELVKGEMETLFDRTKLRRPDARLLNRKLCNLWPDYDRIQALVFLREKSNLKTASVVRRFKQVHCQNPSGPRASEPVNDIKNLMLQLNHPPEWREFLRAVAGDFERQKN